MDENFRFSLQKRQIDERRQKKLKILQGKLDKQYFQQVEFSMRLLLYFKENTLTLLF